MRNSDHIPGSSSASSLPSSSRPERSSASEQKTDSNRPGRSSASEQKTGNDRPALPSKKGKRRRFVTRAVGILVILAIVFGADYMASLSFDTVRIKDYYNYDIARLDREKADVDMIITGTSQVYRGCSPDVISKEMGIGEVVDCASALGTNNGTYYMLRDLLNRFDPEYVLISLAWDSFIPREGGGKLWAEMLIADRLPLMDRLEYVFTCMPPSAWMNLSAMYRFGGTIWGTSQVLKNYRNRKAIAEGNWVDESKRIYRKNGYCWYNGSRPRGTITAEHNVYSDDLVDKNEADYVRKMCELCKERGIKVILFTVPTSMEELYSVENYQAAADYDKAFAEEMGCPYLNFSLLKNREEILPDELYSDHVHMNGPGSETFSRILADTLKKTLNGEDTSSLFYENIDEMKKDVHRVVACSGLVGRDGSGMATVAVTSLQNEDIIPEYRLLTVEKNQTADAQGTAGGTGTENNGENAAENTAENTVENADGAGGENPDGNTAENASEEGNMVENDEGLTADSLNETVTELCPWQSSPSFTVEEARIPPGTTIRIEVRQAGSDEVDSRQDITA